MLLKFVGQEEIVLGQTIVKDSGVYDELGPSMLLKSTIEVEKIVLD